VAKAKEQWGALTVDIEHLGYEAFAVSEPPKFLRSCDNVDASCLQARRKLVHDDASVLVPLPKYPRFRLV